MRKMVLLMIVFFGSFTTAIAQDNKPSAKKDSLITLMANEACAEIIANKDKLNPSDEDFQMELGMLLVPVMMKYSANIEEFYADANDNGGVMAAMGEDIGMKLALNCPEFLAMVTNSQNLQHETNNDLKSITGKLEKIQTGDLSYLLIKTPMGETHKVWWLGKVAGDDLLISKNAMQKNVLIEYTEMSVYNAKVNDYIMIKVAKSVSLK